MMFLITLIALIAIAAAQPLEAKLSVSVEGVTGKTLGRCDAALLRIDHNFKEGRIKIIYDSKLVNPNSFGEFFEFVSGSSPIFHYIHIHPKAPDGRYNVVVEAFGVSSSTFFDLKTDFSVSSKKEVVRGEIIELKVKALGSGKIYVFASEEGVFNLLKFIGSKYPQEIENYTVLKIPGNSFIPSQFKTANFSAKEEEIYIKVSEEADAGEYYLFFYQVCNESLEMDRYADLSAYLKIKVFTAKIIGVDVPDFPYMGRGNVKIKVSKGNTTLSNVSWIIEGKNVKIKPDDCGMNFPRALGSTNELEFTLDLSNCRKLEAGEYFFTATLFSDGREADKIRVPFRILEKKLDAEIFVNDFIEVSVQGEPFATVWVTLVGTNYKDARKLLLDSNGKGKVNFGKLSTKYTVYIRDIAKTVERENELALEYYYLKPSDTLAKIYKADDDLFVVKEVEIQSNSKIKVKPKLIEASVGEIKELEIIVSAESFKILASTGVSIVSADLSNWKESYFSSLPASSAILRGSKPNENSIKLKLKAEKPGNWKIIVKDLDEGDMDFAELYVSRCKIAGHYPKDLDGDGKYEDLNGNGKVDYSDISLFFNNFNWIEENCRESFDQNGNKRLDFADLTELFKKVET